MWPEFMALATWLLATVMFLRAHNWSSAGLNLLWLLTLLCLMGCDVRRLEEKRKGLFARKQADEWEHIAAQWREECFKAKGLDPPTEIDGWVIRNNWKQ